MNARIMADAVDNIHMYMRLAGRLLEHSEEIDANLQHYRFADNMELIKKIIFPETL